LATTFTNQTQGQNGVFGKTQGSQGIVSSIGWDLGSSLRTITNSYTLSGLFTSNTPITATLSWLRQVSMNTNSSSANATDIAEANLDLQVYRINSDGSLNSLVGSSESSYNVTEHLSFTLPTTGYYAVSVRYNNNSFDNTGTWGTGTNTQDYGIAWRSSSSEDIYWQSGTWDNDSSWNTLPNGTGASATSSSVAVNTIFGDGSPSQSTISTFIDGGQYSRGLTFQSGNTTLEGTNNATLYLGQNGINIENTTTGNVTLGSLTEININADQTWNNKSSQTLSVLGQISGNANLTVNNTSSSAEVILGKLNHNGNFQNSGLGNTTVTQEINNQVDSVTQSGAGKLTLNAVNTYTGLTTVNNGTLSVNGSIASSSLTTASNTGTLKGNGTVGNTLITSSGTINPGNSIGLLTIDGDLTWDINGNYNWEIYDASQTAGIGYDSINVLGSLDLSLLSTSNFNINLWSLSSSSPDSNGNAINFDMNQSYLWTIVSTETGITGFDPAFFDINTLAFNGTSGFGNDLNGSFSLSVQDSDLVLAYNAVPEPSAIALISLSACYFWLRKIARRKKNNNFQ
jgi:autotransporter-associated beta strand protein